MKDMEREKIVAQIVKKYAPERIFLFGSSARGTAKKNSDIDLCIIMSTNDKRKLLTDLYYNITSEKPVDFLLYTPAEWERCISDKTSFAYKILHSGVVLHG
ncbi:MAG TPA: nucleotidyltransferase domain-containing protein [Candidatus Wallbacteria bacterium]|nr:nucleotidyltransferase domain-containing protein [Candidatus Wallbacteria bacterium]HPG57062.1 nucleotidyltransferase domain-containing protein [Candidatus Wallbacteria bacterium]